jgi:hypothetical protein
VSLAPADSSRIDVTQGCDSSDSWPWFADGVPVDLGGCHAVFAPKVCPTDTAPLFTVTDVPSPAGSIVLGTGPTAGSVTLNLSAATTAGLTCPVFHGHLVITMTDGTQQDFMAIDGYVDGVGPGKDIVGPTTYYVQPGDFWLRCDCTAGDVDIVLPNAGTGDGQTLTCLLRKGAGRMLVTSPVVNILSEQAGTLVSQLVFQGRGSSVTVSWNATDSEWDES